MRIQRVHHLVSLSYTYMYYIQTLTFRVLESVWTCLGIGLSPFILPVCFFLDVKLVIVKTQHTIHFRFLSQIMHLAYRYIYICKTGRGKNLDLVSTKDIIKRWSIHLYFDCHCIASHITGLLWILRTNLQTNIYGRSNKVVHNLINQVKSLILTGFS